MTAHALADLIIIAAAVGELGLVFWLLGQKQYWKRIARLHENARIDAQSRERALMLACEALRHALGKLDPLALPVPSNDTEPDEGTA